MLATATIGSSETGQRKTGQTLQATALVHEAILASTEKDWGIGFWLVEAKTPQVEPNCTVHRTSKGLCCFHTPIVKPTPTSRTTHLMCCKVQRIDLGFRQIVFASIVPLWLEPVKSW
jgi:hypothetical protein